jgi:hypothetical protein
MVVEIQSRDREHVRRRRIEFEGVLEFDRRDRPAFGTEPALGGESLPVQSPERGRDVPVGDVGPRCQC